jgi:hypothetical protein
MFLTAQQFQVQLEQRFHCDFNMISPDPEVEIMFATIAKLVDVVVYTKLLSILDETEQAGFVAFFTNCLRKYIFYDPKVVPSRLEENLYQSTESQLMCLACLQYYFA